MGTTQYIEHFDHARGIAMLVWFETDRDDVTDYAVVLVVRHRVSVRTVRVYDGAHGHNELHRYTKELGKRPGEIVHRGTLGEGMRSAIEAIKQGYKEMIDGWRRG